VVAVSRGGTVKRGGAFLAVVLFLAALLAPAVVDAAPAGASQPCNSWSISVPKAGFGVIETDGSATCINFLGFGDEYFIAKIWNLESDGHYHMIAQGVTTVPCQDVPAYGVSVCSGKVHAQTGVYPPAGRYHAELEVIGAYTSQAPGFEFLDDANSASMCYFC
jgi:hypothetical protein